MCRQIASESSSLVQLAFDQPVLVTRPVEQATRLCRFIEESGGGYFQFPVLEIVASEQQAVLQETLKQLDGFDIAIFISANAVEHVMSSLQLIRAWPAGVQIAVIGKRSAEEVSSFGLSADLCPESQFDSDGLLALPTLQALKDKKIVIFRGNGGRDYLAGQLHNRGADVHYVEAYQRRRPAHYDGEGLKIWLQQNEFITTAYSNESLQNLMDMMDEEGRNLLRGGLLVIVSPRMKRLVNKLGFEHQPIVARSALDEDVLLAIECAQKQS